MNTNLENNDDQEIDLSVLTKKIRGFYESILSCIFGWILFTKRNAKYLIGLFVIGFGLGLYLDNTNNSYRSEIIVSPNMGGTDYLYAKIDLLKSKLSEDDKDFFKSIGVKNFDKINSIEVEPIIDIYNFVNNSTSAASAQNTQNFEMIKLLAETSSIDKIIKDKVTSKNFPHHLITINTVGKTNNIETVDPLLKYLNTDDYLNQILKVSRENVLIKMKKNEELINQTDSLIRILTVNLTKNQKGSNLVYNNENNQINAFFELKNSLINELGAQRISLINNNAIIKDISTIINVRNDKGLNGKIEIILPLLLIFLYLLIKLFLSFYKNQKEKIISK